jgi:hypothetical protein
VTSPAGTGPAMVALAAAGYRGRHPVGTSEVGGAPGAGMADRVAGRYSLWRVAG